MVNLLKMLMYFSSPSDLSQTLRLMQGENTAVIAGGTDLVPLMKNGCKRIDSLVDLSRISDLKRIEFNTDRLYLGAMATLSDINNNQKIRSEFPAIAVASGHVATPQIRNRATIGGNILQSRRCLYYNQSDHWRKSLPPCYKLGGNICFQIPKAQKCYAIYYSELAPVLLAYRAQVEVFEYNEFHLMPIKTFIEQYIKDDNLLNQKKMLVTGFIIQGHADYESEFYKASMRSCIDFATINIAICWLFDSCDKSRDIRIIVGSVAGKPIELIDTAALIYKMLEKGEVDYLYARDFAEAEIKAKSKIIEETAISTRVKRNSFKYINIPLKAVFEKSSLL